MDAVDLARPSQLEEVAEEVLETASSGSVGSDSLYDLSLEKFQDSAPDLSPSAKSRQVDFERVPSSLGSDMVGDHDDNSNTSSLFYLVISDESNDEETPDSCPVSPDANLDTSSESSLFSVSKKLLPQQEKGRLLKHDNDNDNDIMTKSLPSSNIVEVETNSGTLDSPCLNTKAGRKPATLPRRKVDNEASPTTSSSSTGIRSIATDRKQCPKTMPRRSNTDGVPQVSSTPAVTPHELDKEKPPVAPRKRSPSTEGVDTTTTSAPVPKPRRKKNTVHTVTEGVKSKPSGNLRSPELPKAVTQFSVFKKDFYATNVSWSAENSPVMARKVHSNELTNMKQHLRPLSTCSGGLTTPRNSQVIPKSASIDCLKGEESPLILPSATPAIEMAPFEEDWKERFTHHKRRSKTLKFPGMMRVRSQLIEVKGTNMSHTA